MKIILSFFIATALLMSSNSCVRAQSDEKQVITMLKEFYLAHYNVWSIKPPPPSNVLDEKLDSLQEKYCTLMLRSKAKKQLKYGQDLLTNDYGLDLLSIQTLSISKDTVKKDVYIVSYNTFNELVPNVSMKKMKVVIYVTVKKENGIYKIDDIK